MLNLDKNKKYLLACSYGTDSMMLFDLLIKEGYNFSVAHVNYNLRDESTFEMNSIKEICETHNIRIYIKEIDKFFDHSNIEAKCRNIRYNFFREVYSQGGFNALLVAHQQDDLIETYLLQKKRKTVVSFYGLKRERESFGMKIIRPMLGFTKSDVEQYLKTNNVPHNIDKSNLTSVYVRNKIRHDIVSKMNKSQREEIIKEIDELNDNLCKIRSKLEKTNLNSVDTLLEMSEEEFNISIHMLIERSGLYFPISRKFARSIRQVLLSNKPNIEVEISDFIKMVKEYDFVRFCFKQEDDNSFEYILEKPTKLVTPYFSLDFSNSFENRNIKEEDFPLTIRNGRPNDEFLVKDYYVKLRRAFIDWKMPTYLRSRWPVICNKNGEVIYVPRYSKKFSPTGEENFIVKLG